MSAPDRVWFERSLRPRTSIALSILLFSSFVHVFFAFFFAGLNGLGTALFGTESTVLSARVKRSAASGPSIISGWGFIISIIMPIVFSGVQFTAVRDASTGPANLQACDQTRSLRSVSCPPGATLHRRDVPEYPRRRRGVYVCATQGARKS